MASRAHQGQIAGTHWDPQLYLRFADHRLRPALELLGRVPVESPEVVFDLGCGVGQITRMIAAQWPAAKVYGLDNSAEMLDQARREPGPVDWVAGDIRTWQPEGAVDVIYSNATLQWLDGHGVLFPRLISFLRPGGCLAVQVPLSWAAPSHRLMRETLADGGRDGTALGTDQLRRAVGRDWVEQAAAYYDLLAGLTRTLDIWETEYLQILEGNDPVLEWVKGTGLRPILNGLEGDERERFLAEYTQRLRVAYPMRADGRTLYPFRRLFIVATV